MRGQTRHGRAGRQAGSLAGGMAHGDGAATGSMHGRDQSWAHERTGNLQAHHAAARVRQRGAAPGSQACMSACAASRFRLSPTVNAPNSRRAGRRSPTSVHSAVLLYALCVRLRAAHGGAGLLAREGTAPGLGWLGRR